MHHPEQGESEARERVIAVARQLFSEHGYQAVTLRDIGQALGIRHTSLYHHFPQGKEELFVEVTARRMGVYRQGLEAAIQQAGNDWRDCLHAAALWLLDQPAMHLGRMLQADMSQISAEAAIKLKEIIFASLLQPLNAVLCVALADNPEKLQRSLTIAGMFYSLIEGIDNLPASYIKGTKPELVEIVLDVFINGLK
jgi:TetR/AcrR family transcriptional regulator, cholesterol catabolism regulator